MRIYLDCCCYNRPFDDLTQERIKIESEIIMWVLEEGRSGNCEIIASAALSSEISRITNFERQQGIMGLYQIPGEFVNLTEEIKRRAAEIRGVSRIQTFDSYHIASAEAANADVLLSTDDKLVRMASRLQLKVEVMNPLQFLNKVMYGGDFE
ncbi:MAG: PIN domain-containing protein [Lachnospiraceae bacterium]|nr:PIN domain-containing protein [Lachnospiraceae bacterium]